MVRTKICGFTNPEDAIAACEIGVDMVGVIVDINLPTPRNLDVEQANRILNEVSEDVKKVVVTTIEDLKEAENLVDNLDPDFLEIYNELSMNKLKEIREKTGTKIINVFHVSKNYQKLDNVLSEAKDAATFSDMVSLDTKSGRGGGTGETHDWGVSAAITDKLDVPILLAGGLNPSNVRRAIERVKPYAVDVSSGVESAPGKKDRDLMKEFVREAGD